MNPCEQAKKVDGRLPRDRMARRARSSLVNLLEGNENIATQVEEPVVREPVNSSSSRIPSAVSTQPLLPSNECVKVNRFNKSVEGFRQVANTSLYWHKICILRGAGYDKLSLLHGLITAVKPLLITPVKFTQEGGDVTFLLRDCVFVFDNLIKNNCKIKVPCVDLRSQKMKTMIRQEIYKWMPSQMPTFPAGEQINNMVKEVGEDLHELDIEIFLRHTHVQDLNIHPMEILQSAVTKRCNYEESMKSLDLSSFLDDEELSGTLLWPLWPANAMLVALNCVRSHWGTIQRVNLSDNHLTSIRFLAELPNLRVLDVSGNRLLRTSCLLPIRMLPISDLTLDRNPLCSSFADEPSYIRAIRIAAPYVRKLDGMYLPRRPDMPCWRPNYIPPDHQTECTALVDQFLQHFFTLLDGDDRTRLRAMYHPGAYFSLTCIEGTSVDLTTSSSWAQYASESHNLVSTSDFSKMNQLVRQGAEEVLFTICRLPATEHDPYSFTVDVPFFNHDAAMVVVHGVFREPPNIKDVRAFSRLFILRKVDENEYQIANEMFTVRKPTSKQMEKSFLRAKPKVLQAKLSFNPAQDLSDADCGEMVTVLSRITEMNRTWAAKVLCESKWDMKKALLVFRELLRMNKLPAEALLPEQDRT